MEQLINEINQNSIYLFLLLLGRIVSFFAFLPVFSHTNVSPQIRIGASFFFAIFLFPLVDKNIIITQDRFLLGLIGEITFGLLGSIFIQIIFSAVQIIGDLIGFATALSMGSMFDPATGTSQGLIPRFLYLIVLVVFFESDMYNATLLLIAKTIGVIHLGQFDITSFDGIKLAINEMIHMFLFAFSFSFPLFFISFILDVYYGYGTKSMPSFSPFIVTFQIKFLLIFVFLMLGIDVLINSFINYFINKFYI